MAHVLTTALILPYSNSAQLPYAFYTVTDDDPTGITTAMNAGYHRTWLASVADGNGSETRPYELVRQVNLSVGNARWTIGLNTDCKMTIQYLGTVTTGVFHFSRSINAVFGFTGSQLNRFLPGQNQTVTADFPPYGTILSFNRTDDSGWQNERSMIVGQDMPDGSGYFWSDTYFKQSRKFSLGFHPMDKNVRRDLGSPASPAFLLTKSFWKQPPVQSTYTTASIPYSFQQFMYEAPGHPIAACFGDLQSVLTGSSKKYDIVYIKAKTAQSPSIFNQQVKGWDKYYVLKDLEFGHYATGSRD